MTRALAKTKDPASEAVPNMAEVMEAVAEAVVEETKDSLLMISNSMTITKFVQEGRAQRSEI